MLRWPQDIPQAAREAIGPKNCFRVGRTHATVAARLAKEPVRLSYNAFLLVMCGSVVLERTGQRLCLDEGSGCLVLPGDMRVTEVPDRIGRFRYEVIFFDDRAIRATVRNHPEFEALAAIMRPAFVELYPIHTVSTRWLCSLVISGRSMPNGVTGLLRRLLHDVSVPAYLFLRHGYFTRRRALDLWLEDHLISTETIKQIAARFPGGARRFFAAFKTYQDLSPSRWLRRRRMELARVWLQHGGQIDAVVYQALGFENESTFKRDYKLEHGGAVGCLARLHEGPTMEITTFLETIRPFWLVDQTTWQRLENAKEIERQAFHSTASSDGRRKPTGTPASKENRVAAVHGLDETARPSDEWIRSVAKAFWARQTTAVDALLLRQLEDDLQPMERDMTITPVEPMLTMS